MITGCTDGIGEALSFEFARKGLNLVLISRDEKKLESTKQRIMIQYPTTECIISAIDFSSFTPANRTAITELLAPLDVGILVNNVGASYPFTKYFHELQDSSVDGIMSVNVESTTWMTRIVLPGMIQRKRGSIVNMSSAAGVTVSPLLSQYSAAKSYVTMFSKALSIELADFNIHVQVQIPLYVATKLSKIWSTSFLVPSAQDFARASVACIGYEYMVSPYWSHAICLWCMSFIPEWFIEAWLVKLSHYSIRRAGLRKEQSKRES